MSRTIRDRANAIHQATRDLAKAAEDETAEHLHQLDALKARVVELEAEVAALRAGQAGGQQEAPGYVEGECMEDLSIVPAGFDPVKTASEQGCRRACFYRNRWFLYHDTGDPAPSAATREQAIRWVVEGVAP